LRTILSNRIGRSRLADKLTCDFDEAGDRKCVAVEQISSSDTADLGISTLAHAKSNRQASADAQTTYCAPTGELPLTIELFPWVLVCRL
jgi:hypothetical protein